MIYHVWMEQDFTIIHGSASVTMRLRYERCQVERTDSTRTPWFGQSARGVPTFIDVIKNVNRQPELSP